MSQPASEAYEVVVIETAVPKSLPRRLFNRLSNLLGLARDSNDPGGMIISVIHRATGDEVFRHVEDMGDDEDHLLYGIRQDLDSMTAAEFAERWTS